MSATIYDKSLQHFGNIDYVFKLCYDNDISIHSSIPSDLTIDNEAFGDETIKDYFKLNNITPENGTDSDAGYSGGSNWILADGSWNDGGVWDDNAKWID